MNKKCLWLIVLVASGAVLITLSGLCPMLLHTCRMRRAITQSGLRVISTIGDAVIDYAIQHGQMPSAARWAEIILANNPSLTTASFQIPQLENVTSSIAFNSNLSEVKYEDIQGCTVLLFEADGQLNLAGGSDLMELPRSKDKYFRTLLLSKDEFVYIYFVDKTIVRYRLRDRKISKYDRDTKQFSPYVKDSKYLPIQWRP